MNIRLNSPHRTKENAYYNSIRNAKISGNIRKPSWLYDRALKGYFINVSKGDTSAALDFTNQLDSMITVLDAIHGENWDFHLEKNISFSKGYLLYVLIHYKEINITNTDGHHHLIKDLIVSFFIEPSSFDFISDDGVRSKVFPLGDLAGGRATLSYAEYFSSYQHSHISSRTVNERDNILRMYSFCLGAETEIVDLILGLTTEYSPEAFELYLLTVTSIVHWESIEGVPYTKITNIKVSSSSARNATDLSKTSCRDYYPNIRKGIEDFNFNFLFSEGRYKIKNDKVLAKIIHSSVLKKIVRSSYPYILVIKSEEKLYGYFNGDYKTKEELKEQFKTGSGETPYLLIRDKKIEFNVEPCEITIPDINTYSVHPNLIEYVSTELEKELYRKAIRKHTVDRHYQSSNV
jgi:hypothetical protein